MKLLLPTRKPEPVNLGPSLKTMDLTKAAAFYKHQTGFEPHQYLASVVADAGPQGRANALLDDLDWYRRHTEETLHRVRRVINKSIG